VDWQRVDVERLAGALVAKRRHHSDGGLMLARRHAGGGGAGDATVGTDQARVRISVMTDRWEIGREEVLVMSNPQPDRTPSASQRLTFRGAKSRGGEILLG
jgi:hypothetical protein